MNLEKPLLAHRNNNACSLSGFAERGKKLVGMTACRTLPFEAGIRLGEERLLTNRSPIVVLWV